MPELPEVECIRKGIVEQFLQQKIRKAWYGPLPNLLDPQSAPLRHLQGQTLLRVPLIIPSRANRLQSHQSFVALFRDISQLASCKSPYGLAILASVSPASLPS